MGYKRERHRNLTRVILYRYLDTKSNDKFEAYINKNVGADMTSDEAAALIKHFRKEIYPVDKTIISWMMVNLNKNEIKFHSKFKEMKKLMKS